MRGKAKRRRDRRVEAPEAIGGLIAAYVKRQHLGPQLHYHELRARWGALVGQRIAARTDPLQFEHGVLTIGVANSSWLNELSYLQEALKDRINAARGTDEIATIRLVVAPGATTRAAARRASPVKATPRPPASPDVLATRCAALEQELAPLVPDPALREAIIRARLRGQA